MSPITYMIISFAAGLALGSLFFGGLWFTVKKAVTAKNTALWFSGSSLLRTGITIVGFYYVSGGSWQRLLLCVLGFIIARFVVIWITKPVEAKDSQPKNLQKS